MIRQSLFHGAWPWVRVCVQTATLLVLARVLAAEDYGRYVTALAVAACIAPLLVSGPAYVYLDSHAAFGSTRGQIATVWTRALLVGGFGCALLVALCMAVLAGDWGGAGLWFLVGATEIALAGFADMTARHYQAAVRFGAMGFWQTLPHGLRLIAVLVVLASGVAMSLATWIAIAFGLSCLAAVAGAPRVARQDAPRGLDSLVRLVRVGFRFGGGGFAHQLKAEGDKPFIARIVDPVASGGVFFAQRVADLLCFPLQVAIANSLPLLLEADASERTRAWRRALAWPLLYAVVAGLALLAAAPLLRGLGPDDAIVVQAVAWFCWLPLLGFARGMLGNAAVVAGLGTVHARAHWLGAAVRIVAAVCLLGLFGWPGAVASLLLAELVPSLYLLVVLRVLPRSGVARAHVETERVGDER